jgi:hypothetical protein
MYELAHIQKNVRAVQRKCSGEEGEWCGAGAIEVIELEGKRRTSAIASSQKEIHRDRSEGLKGF